MMKHVLMIILALLICATAGMAEGEHKGGRDNGSMNLLNEGIALMNGDGVAQDYDAAMQRFLAADEAGNKKAARYVGLLYEHGLGVEQDYAQAAFWYEKGVSAGDLTSGYYLGLLYKQGLGVEQDYKKAAEYFTSIAASESKSATGVIDAGYELAQLYEQGLPHSCNARYAWDFLRHFARTEDGTIVEIDADRKEFRNDGFAFLYAKPGPLPPLSPVFRRNTRLGLYHGPGSFVNLSGLPCRDSISRDFPRVHRVLRVIRVMRVRRVMIEFILYPMC